MKKQLSLNQALTLANSYRSKGQIDKAHQIYSMVLARFPQNKKAKKGLRQLDNNSNRGISPGLEIQIGKLAELQSNGMFEIALEHAKRLSITHPDVPSLQTIQAACHVALGQLEAAVFCYQRALKIVPADVEILNFLGITQSRLGLQEAACSNFRQVLRIRPDYVEVHNNLGLVLKGQGDLEGAIESYTRALKLKPDYAVAQNNLGVALNDARQLHAAHEAFKRAVDIKPDHAGAHYNLGKILNELGEPVAAIVSFNRVVEIQPDNFSAYIDLGITFRILGQVEASKVSFEKALEINPSCAVAYYSLSLLKTFTPDDVQIDQMNQLLSNSGLAHSDRIHLSFALSKAYDDIRDCQKSFNFLLEANHLRNKELEYNIENDKIRFTSVKAIFSSQSDFLTVSPLEQPSTVQPIFIVGMPRSGTSLVEQILASHSDVFGAGELKALNQILNPVIKINSDHSDAEWKKQVSQFDIEELRKSYLSELVGLEVPEKIITDKMPMNFIWIGFILSAFPAAKIINLNRDPRATCWSIFKNDFSGKGIGFAYDLENLATFHNLYMDLMSFWREKFPNKIYDINYEKLTENQEEETRKLLNYCDLNWQDQCLNFHKNERLVNTLSASQVRQNMYKGASDAWRKYEPQLRPLINSLGQ